MNTARCEKRFQNGLPETEVHPCSNSKSDNHTQFLHSVHQLVSMNKNIQEKRPESNVKTQDNCSTVHCVNS